jgi:uncharacterized protein YcfJ
MKRAIQIAILSIVSFSLAATGIPVQAAQPMNPAQVAVAWHHDDDRDRHNQEWRDHGDRYDGRYYDHDHHAGRSAAIIAGSAAAGAAIGAAAGHGEGAAIGAVVGGVAGLVADQAVRHHDGR